MSGNDYRRAISNEKIEEWSLAMLDNLVNCELRDTAKDILEKKRAAYQENILEDLCMDMNK